MYVNHNPIWTTLTTVPEVTCANTVLHYSGSVINPDWQCLAEQLLTDTDSAWLTVIILHWHQQLPVIECTQSQKISDTNSSQCFRYCKHSHFPSPHCHWQLTVINWHWQSLTDTGSHQLTMTVINWHWQLTVPDCIQSHIDLVLTLLGDTADFPFEPEFPRL